MAGQRQQFKFTVASLHALATDRTTAEKMFDIDLQAVENDTRKREPLAGVGVDAATVDLGDDAALIEVQRTDASRG